MLWRGHATLSKQHEKQVVNLFNIGIENAYCQQWRPENMAATTTVHIYLVQLKNSGQQLHMLNLYLVYIENCPHPVTVTVPKRGYIEGTPHWTKSWIPFFKWNPGPKKAEPTGWHSQLVIASFSTHQPSWPFPWLLPVFGDHPLPWSWGLSDMGRWWEIPQKLPQNDFKRTMFDFNHRTRRRISRKPKVTC